RKLIITLSTAIVLSLATQAQDIPQGQIPSVILNQFNKQFPKATDIEWEMNGDLYNVDFETGWNIDHEVWYNAEGKIVKHKEDISKAKLPKVVKDRIQSDFKGYFIDDLERITNNGKVAYKMEMNALTQTDWG